MTDSHNMNHISSIIRCVAAHLFVNVFLSIPSSTSAHMYSLFGWPGALPLLFIYDVLFQYSNTRCFVAISMHGAQTLLCLQYVCVILISMSYLSVCGGKLFGGSSSTNT